MEEITESARQIIKSTIDIYFKNYKNFLITKHFIDNINSFKMDNNLFVNKNINYE